MVVHGTRAIIYENASRVSRHAPRAALPGTAGSSELNVERKKPRTTGAFSDAHTNAVTLLSRPGDYGFDDFRDQEQHDGAAEVFAHGLHVS